MGIDIYTRWKEQTETEERAQCTGFSIESGNVGYLREAYHGAPYATKYLVQEAFEDREGDGVHIPAETLRDRLPATVLLAIIREKTVYGEDSPAIIDISELDERLRDIYANQVGDMTHDELASQFTPETLSNVQRLIDNNMLSDTVQAFVDFVELCEKKEAETGEAVTIIASY